MSSAHASQSMVSGEVSRIPPGWTRPQLKEICEVNPPRPPVLAEATQALAEGSKIRESITKAQLPDSARACSGRQAKPRPLPRRLYVQAKRARVSRLEITDCDFNLGWLQAGRSLRVHRARGRDAIERSPQQARHPGQRRACAPSFGCAGCSPRMLTSPGSSMRLRKNTTPSSRSSSTRSANS